MGTQGAGHDALGKVLWIEVKCQSQGYLEIKYVISFR